MKIIEIFLLINCYYFFWDSNYELIFKDFSRIFDWEFWKKSFREFFSDIEFISSTQKSGITAPYNLMEDETINIKFSNINFNSFNCTFFTCKFYIFYIYTMFTDCIYWNQILRLYNLCKDLEDSKTFQGIVSYNKKVPSKICISITSSHEE